MSVEEEITGVARAPRDAFPNLRPVTVSVTVEATAIETNDMTETTADGTTDLRIDDKIIGLDEVNLTHVGSDGGAQLRTI